MKKLTLFIAALATAACAFAFPKAIYVKQDGAYTKYNFGVAGDLKFSADGKTLTVTGYSEAIDLSKIDYITFDAPVEEIALSPSQQKERMVAIGEKVNAMIDLNDNAELLRMQHEFFDSGYWDEKEDRWHNSPCEFEVPEEYWNVHNTAKTMINAACSMAKGNPAAARIFKANAVDLYKASDYFGVYNADYNKEKWVKIADAEYLEIRFRAADSDNYVVKLVCSDDYTTWKTKDFDGQMPKTMTFTFAKGKQALASAELKTTLVQDKSIDMTLHFDANGYVADNEMKVVDKGIDDVATVTIKGKYFCKAVSHIDGKNLVNYDVVYDAVKAAQEYYDEDEYEYVDGDPHALMALFTRANADVDVINELQAKGKIFAISKIYDALEDDGDLREVMTAKGRVWSQGKISKIEGDDIYVDDNDKDVTAAHNLYLNNYTDATFYYDGDNQLQGFLAWDIDDDCESWEAYNYDYDGILTSGYIILEGYLVSVYRDIDYIWDETTHENKRVVSDWYHWAYDDNWNDNKITVKESDVIHPSMIHTTYYETMPLLVFPDLTSFAFEDFFDEDSFSKLIDDYDDIIDTYFSITGQERDSDD